MEFKIYTMQHQRLFEGIHNIEPTTKINGILNKENSYLLEKYKEIRKDFVTLSKSREIDALFSDIMIKNKSRILTFEHIVVRNNVIYVIERKKGYENQRKLLKEKANFLKKVFKNNIKVKCFILLDTKTTRENYIAMDDFINNLEKNNLPDLTCQKINDYIQSHHIDLNIKQYIKFKYKIDIDKVYAPRKAKWVEIISLSLPFLIKNKSKVSFLTSITLMFYIFIVALSYYKNIQDGHFYLSIIIDIFYYKVLDFGLTTIEQKASKTLKYPMLIGCLCMMLGLFIKTIYYF